MYSIYIIYIYILCVCLVCLKVQDTVAESLSGLLDGMSWLLRYSGLRI